MKEQKHIRILEGVVVKNAHNKTVLVSVERRVKHPIYGKYQLRTSNIMAHDETNSCHMGDRVRIKEHRPLSKHKKWALVEIVEKAQSVG